jgi:superfamily II DNA or RNA helicase
MQKVPTILDDAIRFKVDDLGADVVLELEGAFSHSNPEFAKKQRFGIWTGDTPREIATFENDGVDFTLPRGGVARIREVFDRYGLTMSVDDRRELGRDLDDLGGPIPSSVLTMRDYQDEVIEAAKAKQNCLIRSPTGSGKTTAMIKFATEVQLPTLIIVWDSNLFEQWRARIRAELGGYEPGIIRGKKLDLKGVTVAMQQTLNKLDPEIRALVHSTFGVVICDEVQRFAARTFLDTVATFPAKYRIGVSDDETRKDEKDFLIYDLFGQLVAQVDEKKLIKSGAILEVDLVVVPTDFDDRQYVHASAASGLRASGTRDPAELERELTRRFPVASREEILAAAYSKKPDFHGLAVKTMNDVERNEQAVELAVREVEKGEKVLVFALRREHVLRLDAMLSARGVKSGVLIGGPDYSHQFAETVKKIKAGEFRAAVGTIQAIGQGLDLPSISRGVCATHIANNRQFFRQVRGRLCRPGSSDAILYYLWDRKVFPSALRNLKKWNRRAYIETNNESRLTLASYMKKGK